MKKCTIAFACLFMAAGLQAQVKFPAPSPTQTIKQDFGLGSVEVTYSRPAAKGRKVFGDLVPFDKLWRTGANAATLIKFSEPVEIAGKKIDTGTYALYTIPGTESWQIILNKGVKNWGVDGYKESEDVLKFSVVPSRLGEKMENFTILFDAVTPSSCEMYIVWEKTMVAIPMEANIKERLRKDIEAAMDGDKKPYWQAAQFYNEYDNNLPKALGFINAAVNENPKAFWMWLYKAKIEKAAGKKADAMQSSKTSLALAKEANNMDYVKMNEDLQKTLK